VVVELAILLRRIDKGAHVSLANQSLGMFLVLVLSACNTPATAPIIEERTVHQGSGEGEQKTALSPAEPTTAEAAATPPEPRCTTQLKQGYAVRERIDTEYWQHRRSGTFRDQRDELTARWGEEAGEWAAETRAVLLQIGGPKAKSRFQNAHAPIGMVSGDVQWNNIRNFLRTRLAVLESICKAP
jgi:hypothetical protein